MPETGLDWVLVVDDDADICEALSMTLEICGYNVTTARDGAAALARLRGGMRPCLIILDLMMPQMNGFQFREEQLRDPALRDIPVVILSGDGRAEAKAATLGLVGMRKPVDLEVLIEVVGRSCSGAGAHG
jgi:CheY-like chemotaxis protein